MNLVTKIATVTSAGILAAYATTASAQPANRYHHNTLHSIDQALTSCTGPVNKTYHFKEIELNAQAYSQGVNPVIFGYSKTDDKARLAKVDKMKSKETWKAIYRDKATHWAAQRVMEIAAAYNAKGNIPPMEELTTVGQQLITTVIEYNREKSKKPFLDFAQEKAPPKLNSALKKLKEVYAPKVLKERFNPKQIAKDTELAVRYIGGEFKYDKVPLLFLEKPLHSFKIPGIENEHYQGKFDITGVVQCFNHNQVKHAEQLLTSPRGSNARLTAEVVKKVSEMAVESGKPESSSNYIAIKVTDLKISNDNSKQK